ncbi:MAG: indole-3-glycerol phosphate synthase TrpC [Spirochaetaceae bacterium]|nr:indole-3-glycerol phosphate synthase TrpC [Spirochaetaceae bacterium]
MGLLEEICAERKADSRRDALERPWTSLERNAGPARRAFISGSGPLLIAECKRASPSRGLIASGYDPAALAAAYERGGAGMVSVLTEPRRFLGADAHLAAVREAVSIPVLRKDFIVDPYQIKEAWSLGADAVLLIAAALDRGQMFELAACARELSLQVLLEIHAEGELPAAMAAMPDALGVNARDLRSLAVDPSLPGRLIGLLPAQIFAVAESGMSTPESAAALRRAGYDGFLVGEAFSRSREPEHVVRAFIAALRATGPVAAAPEDGI